MDVDATVVSPTRREAGRDDGAGAYDERRAASDAYEAVLATLGEVGPAAEAERVAADLERDGVLFGGSESRVFDVDVVPRIIGGAEWERIEAGVAQRVRALNAFIADVYGERRILAAGVIPERVIEEAEWFEPALASIPDLRAVASVAGPDLVRAPDGGFMVLEDNLRAPSGFAYLLAARARLESLAERSGIEPRPLEPALDALAAAIRAAAPERESDPRIVLLNDGPASSAAYEHRFLAERIGMTIAVAADLRREGERLTLGGEPVDVIYRRIDDERLTGRDGTATPLGELLLPPLRAGTLGCVNSPGTGVADDKAVHVYAEAIVRFYLGEEPLLVSVPGYDLGDPAQLAEAMPRLGELVTKPRSEFGGQGVLIGPRAGAAELDARAELVRRDPHRFVAQETVGLSVHPTVIGDGLAARRVDLRPFAVTDGNLVTVAAGGLTRFARPEGELVVNSGRGGGAKDTWIV